jgi:hypothetical protein
MTPVRDPQPKKTVLIGEPHQRVYERFCSPRPEPAEGLKRREKVRFDYPIICDKRRTAEAPQCRMLQRKPMFRLA